MSILSSAASWLTKGVGTLAGGWQAYAAAAALGAALAGGATFELQQWRLGAAIAEGQAQFAIYRAAVAADAARAADQARTTESRLQTATAALNATHIQEMKDVTAENTGFSTRLAARTLVLRIPVLTANHGSGLSASGGASLLDDVPSAGIELPAATAQSLLAIGDDADADAVKLRACQDYARTIYAALK